jgi:hypothetical protein
MDDFTSYSVAYGLHRAEFDNLPKKTKRQLVRLMSRISEASFRRGFQQGCVLTKRGLVRVDPAELRFRRPLSMSPWPTISLFRGHSAIERLECEYPELRYLGFKFPQGHPLILYPLP